MVSPLSLPCLPNDEVVFTMMSSASVCKIANLHFNYDLKPTANKITLVEAEWRLSVNDHHHYSHHHPYCLDWSQMFLLLNSSPQRQLPRLLITGLSFCTSGGSLFFFLRPASYLDVAMDPQFNEIQYDQKHFIHISKGKYFLLQDSRKKESK